MHWPFAIQNRAINPAVRALLGSRFHGVLSGRMALITVTGRRSGKQFTFPVLYTQDGDLVKIHVAYPAGKRWWRNLRGGAPVRLRLRGVDHSAHAEAIGDKSAGVDVQVQLDSEEHEGTTPT